MDEQNVTGITPANDAHTARKPKPFPAVPSPEESTGEEPAPLPSAEEKRFETPHSVNWTDDTIPRLR